MDKPRKTEKLLIHFLYHNSKCNHRERVILTTNTPERGLFFVLVGPGGAGKDTLMKRIIERMTGTQHHITRLVTSTTRPPRAQEQNGVDYHFKTHEEFQQMIDEDALVEYTPVTKGNFYGIPRASVDDKIIRGEHVIGHVDVIGAKIVREQYPTDAVLIFVTVSGTPEEQLEELRQRMETRATGNDKPEIIAERIERARTLEIPFAEFCDVIIINDDIDTAEAQLYRVILNAIEHRFVGEQSV